MSIIARVFVLIIGIKKELLNFTTDTPRKENVGYGKEERNQEGYPVFRYKGLNRAHRISYLIHNGPLEEGKVIMHKCNNPSCVNPKHLIQGTQKQNMVHKVKCKRNIGPRGEKQGQSKITAAIAKSIFFDYKIKKIGSSYDIAKKYGISRSTVNSIVNGYNWKHLNLNSYLETFNNLLELGANRNYLMELTKT